MNELNGFGSIRFYYGTLAEWMASTKILAVNEVAVVTDRPGVLVFGQALTSMQKVGPVFAQLGALVAAGVANIKPIVYSSATGIVAHAGGAQLNAVQLAAEFNEVITVAASGDSVKLPSAVAGLAITVKNTGAEALAVFPFLGDSINLLAANASVFIAPGSSKTFRAQDTTVWQEQTGAAAISRTPSAINATATATAAQVASGAITSTSPAATTITLPTVLLLAAFLGMIQGGSFEFIVDNSAGANTVTVAVGAGMTALAVITGGNTLTVASGSIGIFKLYFSSNNVAFLARVA